MNFLTATWSARVTSAALLGCLSLLGLNAVAAGTNTTAAGDTIDWNKERQFWSFKAPQAQARPPLDQLFADYYEDLLKWAPETATSLGRNDYNDRWSNWSKEGREAIQAARRRYMARLQPLESAAKNDEEKLNAALFRYQLQESLDTAALDTFLYSLYQGAGRSVHSQAFTSIQAMPARTVRDYDQILARLELLPQYVAQRIDALRDGMSRGIVQAALVIDIIAEQVRV